MARFVRTSRLNGGQTSQNSSCQNVWKRHFLPSRARLVRLKVATFLWTDFSARSNLSLNCSMLEMSHLELLSLGKVLSGFVKSQRERERELWMPAGLVGPTDKTSVAKFRPAFGYRIHFPIRRSDSSYTSKRVGTGLGCWGKGSRDPVGVRVLRHPAVCKGSLADRAFGAGWRS